MSTAVASRVAAPAAAGPPSPRHRRRARVAAVGGLALALAGAAFALVLWLGDEPPRATVVRTAAESEPAIEELPEPAERRAPETTVSATRAATAVHDRGAYAVTLPDDWVASERDVDHEGVFVESRWHPPGDDDVVFLVDHTRGYRGSPSAAASGVRDGVRQAAGYRERAFAAVQLGGRPAWRWEFELDGLRKIDWFVTACDTGFAALGAAPASRFGRYRATFERAAASLAPTC